LGRLLIFDALSSRWREVKVKNDPECPLCGKHPTIRELKEYSWQCANEQVSFKEMTVREVKNLRDKDPDLYLLDVREEAEWDVAHIDGANLKPLSILKGNFEDIP